MLLWIVSKKKVVFNKLGKVEVKFCGKHRVLPSCVILAIGARRLLRKRCSAYLLHIIDIEARELRLEDISSLGVSRCISR